MNDPSHTDHDRGLLDDLESEYMELAEKGDRKAVRYAMEESVVFECAVVGNVMALLNSSPPSRHLLGELIRKDLIKTLAKYAAPLWAAAELPKRVEATEQMVAEWQEEAA